MSQPEPSLDMTGVAQHSAAIHKITAVTILHTFLPFLLQLNILTVV